MALRCAGVLSPLAPLPLARVQGRTERMSVDVVDGVAMRWCTLTPSPSLTGAGEGSGELRFEALHSINSYARPNVLSAPQVLGAVYSPARLSVYSSAKSGVER